VHDDVEEQLLDDQREAQRVLAGHGVVRAERLDERRRRADGVEPGVEDALVGLRRHTLTPMTRAPLAALAFALAALPALAADIGQVKTAAAR
jgi:hypothetical protein